MLKFPQNILDFLKEPNFMALGTIRKDGSVQMTIVWFEYENGAFRISTTTPRIKYKNIARNPNVTMLIYDRGNPYRYLQIQGNVSDITKEGSYDFIDKLSGRYTGNAKYKNDPERKEDRVIISIEPIRYSSVGFPAA